MLETTALGMTGDIKMTSLKCRSLSVSGLTLNIMERLGDNDAGEQSRRRCTRMWLKLELKSVESIKSDINQEQGEIIDFQS